MRRRAMLRIWGGPGSSGDRSNRRSRGVKGVSSALRGAIVFFCSMARTRGSRAANGGGRALRVVAVERHRSYVDLHPSRLRARLEQHESTVPNRKVQTLRAVTERSLSNIAHFGWPWP